MDSNFWCYIANPNRLKTIGFVETSQQADEEIRTLDPLLGKEMLYH
jgi:hypothetical protein